MKYIKYLLPLVIIVLVCISNVGCSNANRWPFPDTPYDNVYETTFYKDGESQVITSSGCPIIDDSVLYITNYWWQEFDEEGNEEWVRYEDRDFYRMVVPFSSITSVEIIKIDSADDTAKSIKTWNWHE